MKTTKAGIIIYEDGDKIPSDTSATWQCMYMINQLRKELNKAAEIIDNLQEQIDELKNRT